MEEARSLAQELAAEPGYFPQVAAGFVAFEQGDREQAARHFRQAARLRAGAALPHAYLARSLVETEIEQGRLPLRPELAAEAQTALHEAVRINPGLQPAFATLGLVEHYGGGDDAHASAALLKAIELDPRDFASRLMAGLVLEHQGQPELAARELSSVVQNSRRLELVREARERLETLQPRLNPSVGGFDRPQR
jgi:tetratricopeptide (TPR) repeat protein